MRTVDDKGKRLELERNLKKSWLLISEKMIENFEYSDNTPESFRS